MSSLLHLSMSKVIEKAVHAKVLTEMMKLLPTHAPKVVANYVMPRLTNSDPPNDRDGENRKKRRKDAGEPSSRSSRKNKSPVVQAQDNTPADQLQDQEDNHILGPSIVAIENKLKELIQKDELTITDLEGAGLEKLKQQYKNDVELEYHVDQLKATVLTEVEWKISEGDGSKPRSFKRHMSKSTKPHPSFYNNDFHYLSALALKRSTLHLSPSIMLLGQDFFKAEINHRSPSKVYFDKRIISVIQENLIDMVNKNELGRGNKRLKGRDWNDKDIKRSTDMLDKIDQVMKRMEQLR
ncbi:hypothetical protein Tco_0778334 [Tanacetum coccineum]